MDDTDDLVKKLQDILTCSICLSRLENPKTLPCQHTFCFSCLKNVIERGHLVCPLCRAIHVIVDQVTESQVLANNIIITSLSELNFDVFLVKNSINENAKYFERHFKAALNQVWFLFVCVLLPLKPLVHYLDKNCFIESTTKNSLKNFFKFNFLKGLKPPIFLISNKKRYDFILASFFQAENLKPGAYSFYWISI